MNRNRILITTAIVVCACCNLHAQKNKKDTLSLLRDFIRISNSYKQLPLYVKLEITTTDNFPEDDNGNTTTEAEFFIRAGSSYVKFGEFEQVVNDSMALLVSNNLQQMILYSNAAGVVDRMKNMMGSPSQDSSAIRLASKYLPAANGSPGANPGITLSSRLLVHNSSLPRENIEMQFDPQTQLPRQVTTIHRSLLAVDSLQYAGLSTQPALAGKVMMEKEQYFLIREQTTVYVYKTIERETKQKTPVLLADRVTQTGDGEYRPVKSYETYTLTRN